MFFALTVWLITLATVFVFWQQWWWFPEVASQHGQAIDVQFVRTLIVCGLVFVPSQLALGYLYLRFRDKPGARAEYSHGNNTMEVVWTAATTVLFFFMVIPGQSLWADMYLSPAPDDALEIEVTGQQFAWNFRYPGPDGIFGRTRPELIDDSRAEFLGIDPDDPAGRDDIVLPTVAIPVNRPIKMILRSKDVIHNFTVRELRVKQDTVPGLVIPINFVATRTGVFEVACSELCGMNHHTMASTMTILASQEEYEAWLAERAD